MAGTEIIRWQVRLFRYFLPKIHNITDFINALQSVFFLHIFYFKRICLIRFIPGLFTGPENNWFMADSSFIGWKFSYVFTQGKQDFVIHFWNRISSLKILMLENKDQIDVTGFFPRSMLRFLTSTFFKIKKRNWQTRHSKSTAMNVTVLYCLLLVLHRLNDPKTMIVNRI